MKTIYIVKNDIGYEGIERIVFVSDDEEKANSISKRLNAQSEKYYMKHWGTFYVETHNIDELTTDIQGILDFKISHNVEIE